MSNKIITSAITAVLAMNVTSAALPVYAADANDQPSMGGEVQGFEKCYGIAKAGQNDCGTASHSCAGESKTNNDKEAWVYVPTGLCDRIVGGSKTPPEKSS